MSKDRAIYTIEARGNVALEVMVRHHSLDFAATFDAIHESFDSCLKNLESVGIQYEQLKTALAPATDKKEIAFVFDSTKASAAYGDEAFIRMIPLLGTESCSSVLRGDLLILRRDADQYLRQIYSWKISSGQKRTQMYMGCLSKNRVFIAKLFRICIMVFSCLIK